MRCLFNHFFKKINLYLVSLHLVVPYLISVTCRILLWFRVAHFLFSSFFLNYVQLSNIWNFWYNLWFYQWEQREKPSIGLCIHWNANSNFFSLLLLFYILCFHFKCSKGVLFIYTASFGRILSSLWVCLFLHF